nr:hypothetical protein HK105_006254 [Polyrhizophydium stewartii]
MSASPGHHSHYGGANEAHNNGSAYALLELHANSHSPHAHSVHASMPIARPAGDFYGHAIKRPRTDVVAGWSPSQDVAAAVLIGGLHRHAHDTSPAAGPGPLLEAPAFRAGQGLPAAGTTEDAPSFAHDPALDDSGVFGHTTTVDTVSTQSPQAPCPAHAMQAQATALVPLQPVPAPLPAPAPAPGTLSAAAEERISRDIAAGFAEMQRRHDESMQHLTSMVQSTLADVAASNMHLRQLFRQYVARDLQALTGLLEALDSAPVAAERLATPLPQLAAVASSLPPVAARTPTSAVTPMRTPGVCAEPQSDPAPAVLESAQDAGAVPDPALAEAPATVHIAETTNSGAGNQHEEEASARPRRVLRPKRFADGAAAAMDPQSPPQEPEQILPRRATLRKSVSAQMEASSQGDSSQLTPQRGPVSEPERSSRSAAARQSVSSRSRLTPNQGRSLLQRMFAVDTVPQAWERYFHGNSEFRSAVEMDRDHGWIWRSGNSDQASHSRIKVVIKTAQKLMELGGLDENAALARVEEYRLLNPGGGGVALVTFGKHLTGVRSLKARPYRQDAWDLISRCSNTGPEDVMRCVAAIAPDIVRPIIDNQLNVNDAHALLMLSGSTPSRSAQPHEVPAAEQATEMPADALAGPAVAASRGAEVVPIVEAAPAAEEAIHAIATPSPAARVSGPPESSSLLKPLVGKSLLQRMFAVETVTEVWNMYFYGNEQYKSAVFLEMEHGTAWRNNKTDSPVHSRIKMIVKTVQALMEYGGLTESQALARLEDYRRLHLNGTISQSTLAWHLGRVRSLKIKPFREDAVELFAQKRNIDLMAQAAGLATMAAGLASRFPDAARFAWDSGKQAQEQYSNMSPEAKAKLTEAASASADAAKQTYSWMQSIYPAIMRWGSKPLDRWHQPSSMILWPLASLILFILPVDDLWATTDIPSTKVLYAANQNLYGIDVFSTLSAIYLKTGVLPRVLVEPFQFKIPLWKHIIEYFGAVPSDHPEAIDYLMTVEYPLIVYPGGRHEFFRKKSDGRYELEWRHISISNRLIDDINQFAPKHEYLVVPVASIGVNSMLEILYDLHWNPRKPLDSLPLVRPVSYERQYLTIGMPCKLHDGMYDDVFVQETLQGVIKETLHRREKAGDDRQLLREVRKAAAVVFADDGVVMKSARAVFGVIKKQAKALALYALHQLEVSEEQRSEKADTDDEGPATPKSSPKPRASPSAKPFDFLSHQDVVPLDADSHKHPHTHPHPHPRLEADDFAKPRGRHVVDSSTPEQPSRSWLEAFTETNFRSYSSSETAAFYMNPKFHIFATALGLFAIYYFIHLDKVPVSGRVRFIDVSPQQELDLGMAGYVEVMREYRDLVLPPDHPDVQHVLSVAQRLIAVSGLEHLDWEINVIDDISQVNAFVLPGGKVFVFRGIIPVCADDNGLAVVLGHEIAHQVARHTAETHTWTKAFMMLKFLFMFVLDIGISPATHDFLVDMGLMVRKAAAYA